MYELRYPDETTPTASWLPSKFPTIESSQDDDDGFLTDVMADNRTVYHYGVSASAIREYIHVFDGLTQTDKDNFETFQAAAGGESFRMIDDALSDCGTDTTNYVTVKFAPGGTERQWRYRGAQRWQVRIRLREV